MAIQFFEPQENNDSAFLSDLVKTPEGKKLDKKVFDVLQICSVSSGKGYLVKTEAFTTFLWKNQKTTQQLLEALDYYWEQGNGYVVVAQVDLKHKNLCRLGVDFERTSYWQKKQDSFISTSNLVEDIPLMEGLNPFLPPTAPITQSKALKMADEITSPRQTSHQTSQNGSRSSRKSSKEQSTQKSPYQP